MLDARYCNPNIVALGRNAPEGESQLCKRSHRCKRCRSRDSARPVWEWLTNMWARGPAHPAGSTLPIGDTVPTPRSKAARVCPCWAVGPSNRKTTQAARHKARAAQARTSEAASGALIDAYVPPHVKASIQLAGEVHDSGHLFSCPTYAMIAPRCNIRALLCVQQWINFFGAIVALSLAIAA